MECAGCHRDFWMSVKEPYVAQPLCDACCTEREQAQREARQRERVQ